MVRAHNEGHLPSPHARLLVSPPGRSTAPPGEARETPRQNTGSNALGKKPTVLAQRGFWPSATAPARPATIAQLAPPSQSPTPSGQQRPLRGGDDKAPAPRSEGNGCASLHRFLPPAHLGHLRQRRRPKGGVRWEQGTAPPLGFRHLRRPGALQGHHGGPGATRSARPGGEQRGIGCGPPQPRGGGHPPQTARRGQRECLLRQPTPVPQRREAGAGPESAPLCTPPHRPQAGRRSMGPAGRTRRAVPPTRSVRPSSDAA